MPMTSNYFLRTSSVSLYQQVFFRFFCVPVPYFLPFFFCFSFSYDSLLLPPNLVLHTGKAGTSANLQSNQELFHIATAFALPYSLYQQLNVFPDFLLSPEGANTS